MQARNVIGAFERKVAVGRAAFTFDGAMADNPFVGRARGLLALADKLHLHSLVPGDEAKHVNTTPR
jgi:citrate lyase beta subunit